MSETSDMPGKIPLPVKMSMASLVTVFILGASLCYGISEFTGEVATIDQSPVVEARD